MLRTTTKTTRPMTLDFLSSQEDMVVQDEDKRRLISSKQLNKTWRLAALLQTTLELKSMLKMFSAEVTNTVPHSGIAYIHMKSQTHLSIGRITKQSCSFQLMVEKQELGEITFMSGKPFTQKQRVQLEFLLASLVYPLRNALNYLAAYQSSTTDKLTKKYNRLIINSTLEHEIAIYQRYKTPLTMLFIDIDSFSNINNLYGRGAGNKVLQATADTISNCVRKTDTLVRYGADEFVLFLSNTHLSDAKNLAEHIREVIENMQIISDEDTINYTVSIGGASLQQKDSATSLFANAYEALVQSKLDGRNCIRLSNNIVK